MDQSMKNDYVDEYDLEEAYLKNVYSDMLESQKEWANFIEIATMEGLNEVQKLSEDIRIDFSSYADNIDTLATIEMKNREIDQMNSRIQSSRNLLDNVSRSLESPYFGKVIVDFLDGEPKESFYIGINSYTNQEEKKLVYDWRSPIAELFYNNELGDSSYAVNSNLIEVKIDNRRQFVIEKDNLLRYFDTSVAIQDDILLEALEQDSSAQLQDITATIQSEQNVIIRDTTNPILLVNGVAGSGKTSTIMQRIAYLLYTFKNKISSDNFMILSPNEHFVEYISNVLPSLGEQTPLNLTFRQFVSNHIDLEIESEDQYFERISREEVDEQTQLIRSESFIQFIEQSEELLSKEFDYIKPIYRKKSRTCQKKKLLIFSSKRLVVPHSFKGFKLQNNY
ncbi:UvrD-helicase domain-containing protein [Aerococcaceae bacterium WGS1372]